MDVLAIDEQLRLLNTLGLTLNIDERMKLKLAHIHLMSQNEQLDDLKFWGKIEGLQKNYYIMMGLKFSGAYEFPHKTFYWASQDFQFKQLPELLLQHEELCANFNGYFSGDATKILTNLQGEGQGEAQGEAPPENEQGAPKEEKDEDEEELKKIPKKNFTELHRLSHVVRSIENDAQVVPQGAYKMNPENQLRPNHYFYGLESAVARKLTSWHHFRSPQTQGGRQRIQSENVVFSVDFLDNLEEDLPHGTWSIQVSPEQTSVSCRSLAWPGYYAFHRLKTSIFGSAYIGNGIKNIDLAFML